MSPLLLIPIFADEITGLSAMYSSHEAISLCNQWGAEKIPFLFLIDFEMKAIRLFRLDQPLPEQVKYSFHGNPSGPGSSVSNAFTFSKHPVPFREYETAFRKVQQQIQAGNSFLANLTFPTPVETNLTLAGLYACSRAPYKILVDGLFVCFSPETFIRIRNGIISTYPMKGTIDGCIPGAEEMILNDHKETAEHHTVVDLLRNDLSMVAKEVTVQRFRFADRITTHTGEILQISSEITGKLPVAYHRHLGDILFALLPAGSVTGAPKIKTVALIREAEQADRGYYTGIAGIFDGEQVDSAVLIRYIECHNGNLRFRSGGGITFLSRALDEYNELINKVYVPVA